MVSSEFEKWATQFSGGDGGNIKGGIWFFGVEHGAPVNSERKNDFKFDDASQISEWPSQNQADYYSYLNQHNTRCMKLLTALNDQPVKDYKKFGWDNKVFCKESDYFKFNIYPLPFGNINPNEWDDIWKRRTGLETKGEYISWCEENRFPILRSWYKQFTPKLIIANGLGSKEAFANAFGYDSTKLEHHVLDDSISLYTVENLIIMPHLNYYKNCINTDAKIELVANFIKLNVLGNA